MDNQPNQPEAIDYSVEHLKLMKLRAEERAVYHQLKIEQGRSQQREAHTALVRPFHAVMIGIHTYKLGACIDVFTSMQQRIENQHEATSSQH